MSLLRGIPKSLRRGSAPRLEALHGQLEKAIAASEQRAALALCERILARHPDDTRALSVAAVIRLKSGEPERAASHFARLEEITSGGERSARLVTESLMDPARASRGEPYVAAFDDVLVDPSYWAVIDDDRIYTREIQARTTANSPMVRGRVSRDGRHCVVSLTRAPQCIEEPCILLGSDFNYAHWVLRNVLKLSLLDDADIPRDARFLVQNELRPWQYDYLALVGIPESRLHGVPTGNVVACRRLYIPTQLSSHPRMIDGLAWLRAKVASLLVPPEQATDLIYASRREEKRRRLLNDADVEAALAPLGFRTIVPGDMGVREQIAAFSRARVVVAPHGAGLANLVFAAPGTSLIEISSSAIGEMNEFRLLCQARGMKVRRIVSADLDSEPPEEGMEMHRNYRVDVAELLSTVRELLA